MKKIAQKIKTALWLAWQGVVVAMGCIILLVHLIWEFFSKKIVKEHVALIGTLLFFFAFGAIIQMIDPTAGVYDPGVLQIISLSFVLVAVFNRAGWSIFCTIWPKPGEFMKYKFANAFEKLTTWEKFKVCLSVLFFIQLELLLASIIVR